MKWPWTRHSEDDSLRPDSEVEQMNGAISDEPSRAEQRLDAALAVSHERIRQSEVARYRANVANALITAQTRRRR